MAQGKTAEPPAPRGQGAGEAGQVRARRMVALSMVVFGTVGLFVRGIPLPSGVIALMRAVLAALTIGLILLCQRRPLPWRGLRASLPWLALSGAAMGFNWILLFEAFRHTTISLATLSYYFAPVLVAVFSALLFRERMSRWQTLCFALAALGLLMVIDPRGGRGGEDLLGVLLGLSAAVLYAGVILLNKFIRGVDGMQRTLLQFLAAALVLLPYALLAGGLGLGGLPPRGWLLLMIVGVVHTGLTYRLYFVGISGLSGHQIALLSFIDPVVAVLCSLLFLREPLGPLQALGGALILLFTWLSDRHPVKRRTPDD